MRRFLTVLLVVGITTLVTIMGVRAADWLTTPPICPSDMVAVFSVPGITCVDRFEAAPNRSCPHELVDNPLKTSGNLAVATCATDASGVTEPWRFVAREEARQLCARTGKRLPTAAEWYQIMLGTDMSDCVLTGGGVRRGENEALCKTSSGVYDGVGNVWEWVVDDVTDGMYQGRVLPLDGYVHSVDETGVVSERSDVPDAMFGNDYVRIDERGVRGMVRGGFYGSGDDGGLYALQADIAPSFAAAGIGFRCVR